MSVRCDADSLKLYGAEEVQRRVRKKSLYQWDLSDMSHMRDQVNRPRTYWLGRHHCDGRIHRTDWPA